LHQDHFNQKAKFARAAQEKEKMEEEEAYLLSQQPLKYVNENEVRTLE